MESIIQNNRECLVCGDYRVEQHHVYKGIANRKKSEKYGLKVYLCPEHHRGTNGVHGKNGHNLDMKLKKFAQKKFEEAYPELNFLEIFGRNYL